MKKHSFLMAFTILLISFSNILPAQKIIIGPKGGLNISTLGKKDNGLEARLGYHSGILVNYHFNEDIHFQLEAMISLQGARDEQISEIKNKYLYLSFPLLSELFFTESISLVIGPQISYLVSAKIKDPIMDEDIKDNLRNLDIGVAGGIKYQIPSGLGVEVRYIWGILSTTRTTATSEAKFRNKVLQLSFYISLFNIE